MIQFDTVISHWILLSQYYWCNIAGCVRLAGLIMWVRSLENAFNPITILKFSPASLINLFEISPTPWETNHELVSFLIPSQSQSFFLGWFFTVIPLYWDHSGLPYQHFKGLFDMCKLRLIGFSHFVLVGRKSTRHTGSWLYCCTRTSVWPQAVRMPSKQWLMLAHRCSRISSRTVCSHTSASHMVSITNTPSTSCLRYAINRLFSSSLCHLNILLFFSNERSFCLFRLLAVVFCLLNLY